MWIFLTLNSLLFVGLDLRLISRIDVPKFWLLHTRPFRLVWNSQLSIREALTGTQISLVNAKAGTANSNQRTAHRNEATLAAGAVRLAGFRFQSKFRFGVSHSAPPNTFAMGPRRAAVGWGIGLQYTERSAQRVSQLFWLSKHPWDTWALRVRSWLYCCLFATISHCVLN